MWGNEGGFSNKFGDGANSGAGFMDSPSQFASPGAQSKKQERRTQNIAAVTVKTIHDSDGDTVKLNGNEVHMLVVVGIIRTVEVTSTKITYNIDDSTGVIEGVQWLESDSDFDQDHQKPLMEMTYCKVVGSVRIQMGKKHIMIFNIVPITDVNRITTHLLEVIHDAMKLEQLNIKRGGGTADSEMQSSSSNFNVAPTTTTADFGAGDSHTLSGPAKQIYQMIQMSTDEVGVGRQSIYRNFTGKVTPPSIDNFIDHLCSEGHIYSTIDEDHFKTTDN